ncbi:MAG: hypothetical protein LBK43_03950 [Treponema sp.]|jgi:hypothetical protein|nr:hypothetical protein [Treponema sp.]
MLYPKSKTPVLEKESFANPGAEYRGAPFWAWNGKLDAKTLQDQIEYFKQMGFGGAHLHPRTGLDTAYLSEEYMDAIRACVEKARQENMKVYLYDEDRWPSGAAGGIVSKEEKFRARHLLMTTIPYSESSEPTGTQPSYVKPVRTCNGRLLAVFDIEINTSGSLKSYRRIGENDASQGKKWYAYLETDLPGPWYNNQTYIDTLNPAAVKRFVEVTHEAYKKAVGVDFGSLIPSIFADEPMFSYETALPFPETEGDVVIPWTDTIGDSYARLYKEDLLEKVPEILWELPDHAPSLARYRYHDLLAELFSTSFSHTIGDWCKKNNLLFTGHLMWEPALHSQTIAVGEAMRSYPAFGLPGVDMLGSRYEFTTLKQAQSVAHQCDREGMMSELYGVTSWSFDFRGHKIHGDWQAALGITLRVPHLSLYSMAGEAKRDYPASIHYQSPWFKEYPYIENHFARVNTALTRGKPVISVAVIHPIESFWIRFGPWSQTYSMTERLEQQFSDITQWLIFSGIDFNFISESLLPGQCEKGGSPLKVGAMSYDTIIVPGCETLRSSTLERLEAFRAAGGRLIFMSEPPQLVDAVPGSRAKILAEQSIHISFEKQPLLMALEPVRKVAFYIEKTGETARQFIHQMRKDGDCYWLFIAHAVSDQFRVFSTPRRRGEDELNPENVRIVLTGIFAAEEYNTLTGEIAPAPAKIQNGKTIINWEFGFHDSLLLRLIPTDEPSEFKPRQKLVFTRTLPIPGVVKVSLEEPNVFLMDRAQLSLDDGEFMEEEEILKADNILRSRLGLPPREAQVAQPWVVPKVPPSHKVRARIVVESEITLDMITLAGEELDDSEILWNGVKVTNRPEGYYVDRVIKKLVLGALKKGANTLELSFPYGQRTNVEWYYLLGDFGVRVQGKRGVIIPPARELAFGDITTQGLPFYGGNLTYHLPLPKDCTGLTNIQILHYKGAMVGVFGDGKRLGNVAFAPYNLQFTAPASGSIDMILYGNRVNSFGSVHMADEEHRLLSPMSYRTTGSHWSDEYVLEKTGILSSPRISI